MLDRGVWGNALPPHHHTITSCSLRFITRSWKPSHLVFNTRSWQSDQKIMAFRFLGLAHRFRPFDFSLERTDCDY